MPAWNGKDHIRQLADTLPCNNSEWRNQFQQTPVEEQLFFQYFRLLEAGEKGELLPAAEILRHIEQRSKIKSGIRNMSLFGRLVLKNNVTKKHTKTGNYYHVIQLL